MDLPKKGSSNFVDKTNQNATGQFLDTVLRNLNPFVLHHRIKNSMIHGGTYVPPKGKILDADGNDFIGQIERGIRVREIMANYDMVDLPPMPRTAKETPESIKARGSRK